MHCDVNDLRSLINPDPGHLNGTHPRFLSATFSPLHPLPFAIPILIFFQCDGCLFLFPFSGGSWLGCTFVPAMGELIQSRG